MDLKPRPTFPGRGMIQQNTSRKRSLPIYCRVKEKQECTLCPKLNAQTSNRANTSLADWHQHRAASWPVEHEPATACTAFGINKWTNHTHTKKNHNSSFLSLTILLLMTSHPFERAFHSSEPGRA